MAIVRKTANLGSLCITKTPRLLAAIVRRQMGLTGDDNFRRQFQSQFEAGVDGDFLIHQCSACKGEPVVLRRAFVTMGAGEPSAT